LGSEGTNTRKDGKELGQSLRAQRSTKLVVSGRALVAGIALREKQKKEEKAIYPGPHSQIK